MAKNDITELFSALPHEEMTHTIAALTKIRDDAVEAKRADLMAQLAALGPAPTASPKRSSAKPGDGRSAPKVTHRGPNGETWTNRGQKPKWLQALIDQGKNADDYRVSE